MVYEGPSDQPIVVGEQARYESPNISPLFNTVFQGNTGLEYTPGIGGLHLDLWVDDGCEQFGGSGNLYDIQGLVTADQGESPVNGGGYIVGMRNPAGQSLPFHGKPGQFQIGKRMAQKGVHGPYRSGRTCGTTANTATCLYFFIDLYFKPAVIIAYGQQGQSGYPGNIAQGVRGKVLPRKFGNPYSFFGSLPNHHLIANTVQCQT